MDSVFEQALASHRAGDLPAAEAAYRLILARDPVHVDALHLFGVLTHQLGRHQEALALIDRALAQRRSAIACTNRAAVLSALGHRHEALDSYDQALRQEAGLPQTHAGKAEVLLALSRHADALASYDRALALRAEHAGSWLGRGCALQALGQQAEALASYDRALACDSGLTPAWLNRGVALEALGQHAAAVESYDRAVALRPDDALAYANRGNALHALARHAAAIESFARAFALGLDAAPVWLSHGNALRELDRCDEALASYDRALLLQPNYVEAWNNRGNALRLLGHYDAAIEHYERALAVNPNAHTAQLNKGTVLQIVDQHEAALVCYDSVLAADPENPDAHWNNALCRLALGDFAQGWRDFEWRDHLPGKRHFTEPLWLGQQDIAGRIVLLRAEQGFGDTLQFCRYAPLLAARGARIVLEVPAQLQRLLTTLDGVERVVAKGDALGHFDLQCPMMSLPLAVSTTLETIPNDVPYLRADADAAAVWRGRLAALPGFRIGLVWAGNPRSFNPTAAEVDRRRSFAMARFAPLAAVPGVVLISLQKDAAAAQARTPPAGMVIHDWTGELADFADTATLIAALDLVIGVDTSVVHLAGALGKPVWILNRHDACWRWLRGRADTPWYPTARLFRQRRAGDWDTVIAEVCQALADLPALARTDRGGSNPGHETEMTGAP